MNKLATLIVISSIFLMGCVSTGQNNEDSGWTMNRTGIPWHNIEENSIVELRGNQILLINKETGEEIVAAVMDAEYRIPEAGGFVFDYTVSRKLDSINMIDISFEFPGEDNTGLTTNMYSNFFNGDSAMPEYDSFYDQDTESVTIHREDGPRGRPYTGQYIITNIEVSFDNSKIVLMFDKPEVENPQKLNHSLENLIISFRSDGIEFWATDGNYQNLRSSIYTRLYGPVTGSNDSITIDFSNDNDNTSFSRTGAVLVKHTMPDFDRTRIYDVVRLDLGAGFMNYSVSEIGNFFYPESNVLEEGHLNANSIIFIDRNVLKNTVYVDNQVNHKIIVDYTEDNKLDGIYNFGVDSDFLINFIISNNMTDINRKIVTSDEVYINSVGALFIPFDPIEFNDIQNPNKIKVKLMLDMENIIKSEKDGIYMLQDDADGTPYHFDIKIIEEE